MKGKLFTYLLFLSICSCSAPRISIYPHVSIYATEWVGEVQPSYIILKESLQCFELYSPSISECIHGMFYTQADTMYFMPKYRSIVRDKSIQVFCLEQAEDEDRIIMVPQKLIIKDDCLIDDTDYIPVMRDYLTDQDLVDQGVKPTVYKRVR